MEDDPVIPFRVSHANTLVMIQTEIRIAKQAVVFIGGSSVTILAAILTVLLMKGGG